MRILWRRPLFCCCVISVILVILAAFSPIGVRLALAVCFAVAALIFALFLKKQFRKNFILFLSCLLSCLLLLSSSIYFEFIYPSYQKLVGEECKISGYVIDRRSRSDSYLVVVTRLDDKVHFTAALDCAFSSGVQVGDHIEAKVVGISFAESESYDEEKTLLSENVKILFSCENLEELTRSKEEGFHPLLLFRKWNFTLSARLRSAVGGEAGDLAAALLLGNKSGLSGDTTLAFRRAGVSHLLALSGLHVSILIGALGFFLKKIFRRRWIRLSLVSACLLFYLALTGFRTSCLRAVLMVLLVNAAFLLWEDPDPITSLGIALYLTLLVTPYAIGSLSLWMSYLATFGILVFSPAIRALSDFFSKKIPHRLGKGIGKVLGLLLVGVAANAALLLLLSVEFGEISVASIPTTVVLSIPTTMTLVSSILTLVIPGLGFLPKLFTGWMIDFATLVSDRPGVLPSVKSPFLIGLLIALTLLLLILAVVKIKRPLVFLSIPLAVILIFGATMLTASYRNAERVTEMSEIKIEEGTVYALARNSTESKAVKDIRENLFALGGSEIHHLIFSDYSTRQPYYLSRLSSTTRIFCLHLPKPKTKEELSLSIRLEQEASLHRICVVYD